MTPFLLVLLLAAQATSDSMSATVPAACARVVERALPLLAAGDAATAKRDHRGASRQFDTGLQALGTAYFRRPMRDDTGMRLILARSAERKGQFARAASTRRRVLVERLGLCGAASDTTHVPR